MSAMLSAEQLQFKEAVGRFFDEVSPPGAVRAFVESEAPLPEMSGNERRQNSG